MKTRARRLWCVSLLVFLGIGNTVRAESYYVHRPDPRIYEHGSYTMGIHIAPNGGLLASLCVGFFDRFQIGLSYGGDNMIGTGPINWYSRPGIQAKVSILDETRYKPLSLAVGFDAQIPPGSNQPPGEGITSPGFYLVAGRLFSAGFLGFDLGIGLGYDIMDENTIHCYAVSGLVFADVFRITPELTVYPGRDEDVLDLGVGLRWDITYGMGVEFLLTDIIPGFDPDEEGWTRSLRFQITQEF